MKDILFWWHFHQPLYKSYSSNKYVMPWVLLHLIKDYHFMLTLANRHKNISQNFNFSPVLLEQIEDYIRLKENIDDDFVHYFLKDPKEMNDKEKEFLVIYFFSINSEKYILTNKRYSELLQKKHNKEPFSDGDLLDLQFLFFYSWMDPIVKAENPFLKSVALQSHFSVENKLELWEIIRTVLDEFFPLIEELKARDNIEFTVSPYYHPILPLLMDTDTVSQLNIIKPKIRFSYPEDAIGQMEMALQFAKDKYGLNISGIWPSEGSLDESSLHMLEDMGIKYVGSDERVLRAITKKNNLKSGIYDFDNITIFFRNREISDNIAFKYRYLKPDSAVEQLLKSAEMENSPTIIIMDGENAWEYFDNNGLAFLDTLYIQLEKENFNTYTLKSANDTFQHGNLDHFIPGSWIDIGYPLWIGSEGKNKSWELLSIIRNNVSNEALDNNLILKKELYAIEGSDWNWWYDTFYGTDSGRNFDQLYRTLIKDFINMGHIDLNINLDIPLQKIHESVYYRQPVRLITPLINGVEDNFYEWVYAGFLDTKNISGTMKETHLSIRKVFFGFDMDNLYMRMDFSFVDFDTVSISIFKEDIKKINFNLNNNEVRLNNELTSQIKFAMDEIIEIKIPFDLLNIKKSGEFMFNITLLQNGKIMSVIPTFSHISLSRPDEFFQMKNWRV